MGTEVSATSSGAAQASGLSGGTLDKGAFLKLLLAQLGHQDPLSPMDSNAFVAQLAQFSTVELLQTQASSLDTLIVAQAASNQMQAASLVGRDVVFKSGSVHLDGQAPATLRAELGADAARVTAVITDASGKTVRTLEVAGGAKGPLSFEWDGRDAAGNTLPAGDYSVSVTAAKADGASVPVELRARAKVDGVSFDSGFPELLVEGARIRLADIVQILAADTERPQA